MTVLHVKTQQAGRTIMRRIALRWPEGGKDWRPRGAGGQGGSDVMQAVQVAEVGSLVALVFAVSVAAVVAAKEEELALVVERGMGHPAVRRALAVLRAAVQTPPWVRAVLLVPGVHVVDPAVVEPLRATPFVIVEVAAARTAGHNQGVGPWQRGSTMMMTTTMGTTVNTRSTHRGVTRSTHWEHAAADPSPTAPAAPNGSTPTTHAPPLISLIPTADLMPDRIPAGSQAVK